MATVPLDCPADRPQCVAVDTTNVAKPRQTVIQKRMIGRNKLSYTYIVSNHRRQKCMSFVEYGLLNNDVEAGVQLAIRFGQIDSAEVQPPGGTFLHKISAPFVVQHSIPLLAQHF